MTKDEFDRYQAMILHRLDGYRIILPPSIDKMRKVKK